MKRPALHSLIIHVTGHVTQQDLEGAVRMLRARWGETSVVKAVIRELKPSGPAKERKPHA
jgi:hypothetical protein